MSYPSESSRLLLMTISSMVQAVLGASTKLGIESFL